MSFILKSSAWANGEVGYLAWAASKDLDDDCLGFMLTRVHETGPDAGLRRILPTWIAFTDQSNPQWIDQDSSVWPIQRFEWRDLTLRRSRDTTAVRAIDFSVHYEIVPVGLEKAGRTPVPDGAPYLGSDGTPNYEGPRHPLFQIGEPATTNSIYVTHDYGDGDGDTIKVAFTNGILSTQNLLAQLGDVDKAPPRRLLMAALAPDPKTRIPAERDKEQHLLRTLKKEIANPTSKIRAYLHGDVLEFVSALLKRAEKEGGEVYLALYELQDRELIDLLLDGVTKRRVRLILSNTGKDDTDPKVWDTENDPARAELHAAAGDDADRVIDRMFCTSSRIGHNKFAVYVKEDAAIAVMTGSTNWTNTGLCAQSNNTIIVNDPDVAAAYWSYWKDLRTDEQPPREALTTTTARGTKIIGAAGNSAKQSPALRTADAEQHREYDLGATGKVTLWRSPNTKVSTVPKKPKDAQFVPDCPPDLVEVYDLMSRTKEALLFLTYLPGVSGGNNIIGQAQQLAQKDEAPLVLGAISDPSAMPPPSEPDDGPQEFKDKNGDMKTIPPPAIWWPSGKKSNIAMIRAAAVRIPFGNFRPELLTAGHAIIHDKIIVIDPGDEANCVVITGSHNLGYKASYCNDDNMLIIKGNQALAKAYAVHVLDVYDHYLMRARIEQKIRKQLQDGTLHSLKEADDPADPHGLLKIDTNWRWGRTGPAHRSSGGYILDHP